MVWTLSLSPWQCSSLVILTPLCGSLCLFFMDSYLICLLNIKSPSFKRFVLNSLLILLQLFSSNNKRNSKRFDYPIDWWLFNPYLQSTSFSQGLDFYIQFLGGHFSWEFAWSLKSQDIQTWINHLFLLHEQIFLYFPFMLLHCCLSTFPSKKIGNYLWLWFLITPKFHHQVPPVDLLNVSLGAPSSLCLL